MKYSYDDKMPKKEKNTTSNRLRKPKIYRK